MPCQADETPFFMFRASSERPTQFLEVNSGTERPSAASHDDDAHVVRGRSSASPTAAERAAFTALSAWGRLK